MFRANRDQLSELPLAYLAPGRRCLFHREAIEFALQRACFATSSLGYEEDLLSSARLLSYRISMWIFLLGHPSSWNAE